MAVVAQVDRQVKAVLVARLRHQRATGTLTTATVRAAAAGLGVAERSVWGWLAAGPEGLVTTRRAHYELTEADLDVYAAWRGNVAAVHRELHAGRPGGLSLRRLQHAFATQLTPGTRAGIVEGAEGRRRYEVYLRWEPPARNAIWEGDHVELPVLVLPPRARRPVKPWATLFLDGYSRLVMGWAISLRPNSGTVLATLRAGMVIDPERGPFGGLPAVLRTDHGLEFTAAALERSCAALGVEAVPAPPYTPHGKGKVERVNRTLAQEFLAGLPFYTEGARALDGTLLGPDADPLGLGEFVTRFAAWVVHYNTVRRHGTLGETPLARWSGDPTPLRLVEPEALRWMLAADVERTVQRDGIHFGGVVFIAPALNELVGEPVQVRYTPHDLRRIEVFRGDTWLATAHPQDELTPEQRDAVIARRRADAADLGRRQRRASRRARTQLAPITAPGEIEDATVITADTARADTRPADSPAPRLVADVGDPDAASWERRAHSSGPDYRAMARYAATDLLNLHSDFAYWNPGAEREPSGPAADAEPVDLDPGFDAGAGAVTSDDQEQR